MASWETLHKFKWYHKLRERLEYPFHTITGSNYALNYQNLQAFQPVYVQSWQGCVPKRIAACNCSEMCLY